MKWKPINILMSFLLLYFTFRNNILGANEEQVKKAKSHKKGHVSKGFKSSSSKNEEEKTESFYDEAHDEADHKLAGHNAGSFGENAQQGFKGAHEEKILDANAQGKEGHHVSEQKIDDSKANKVSDNCNRF